MFWVKRELRDMRFNSFLRSNYFVFVCLFDSLASDPYNPKRISKRSQVGGLDCV